MPLSRREMLAACVAALPAVQALAAEEPARKRLGLVAYSFSVRLAADREAGKVGLADPLAFLEQGHRVGAGGVQVTLGVRDRDYITRLRQQLEAWQMYLEGVVRLPQDREDTERFAAEVRTAKEAGASVLRTVLLNGRRYETFATAEAYRQWEKQSAQSLALAEPIVSRQDMRLAVENHKDHRAAELADILKHLDSPHIGVCVDTGNNLALLEEPLQVVQMLAPWAFSVHLKDMAVAEYDDGFLLAEVPLGEGILDLSRIVGTLRKARPEVRFNLEMITRDPLRVPCLTEKYWATFDDLPGRELARTLTLVRQQKRSQPLLQISRLTREEQLAVEEENVQRSLAYAHRHLEL